MRFLILGAIATFLVSLIRSKDQSQNNGGAEALALIATLLVICSVDAFTSKKCEDDISALTAKLYNQKIKVFRDGKVEPEEIFGHDLLVGDVYIIYPGLMIPADSILIQEDDCIDKVSNPYIVEATKEEENKNPLSRISWMMKMP